LSAGLALPVASLASTTSSHTPPAPLPLRAAPTPGKITYRVLGKTRLKVCTVGYGCMITSDPTVITRAVEMGINYLDTCRSYQNGQNERMVGAALGGKRKEVFLSSKCDQKTGAGILAELDTSLKELNTDYLDVWLLHGLGNPAQISDDLVDAQRKAKQQGKVRFIGVSTHTLPAIVDRVIETKLEVVQAQYNFASAAEWGPAFEKLNQAGVGLVAMKVMARA
jgi:aryl-alcohol dehydrogenase-like predicted oxidoreductase